MNHKDMLIPYREEIRTGTPDSILSSLYRLALHENGMDEPSFYIRIDKYVNRTVSAEDIKELSSIKGNLRKELMKAGMTWKVFIKGFLVLNIVKFDIAVKVKITDEETTGEAVRTIVLDKTVNSEKEIGKTESTLRSLFADLMLNLRIDTEKFNELINRYILSAKIPLNVRDISSTRGNIKKEILKSPMSWKIFIKGLMFLNVEKLEIIIRLHQASGKVSTHSRKISFHG